MCVVLKFNTNDQGTHRQSLHWAVSEYESLNQLLYIQEAEYSLKSTSI